MISKLRSVSADALTRIISPTIKLKLLINRCCCCRRRRRRRRFLQAATKEKKQINREMKAAGRKAELQHRSMLATNCMTMAKKLRIEQLSPKSNF